MTAFREVLLDGRSLNLPDGIADSFREGETYEIVVSRLDIFGSMLDELSVPTLNPRLPLKVTFMGEMGHLRGLVADNGRLGRLFFVCLPTHHHLLCYIVWDGILWQIDVTFTINV